MRISSTLAVAVILASTSCFAAGKPEQESGLKNDAEALARAKEICPELLKYRLKIDEMYAEYTVLCLTLGVDVQRDAKRKAPKLGRAIEKALSVLDKGYEKTIKPLEADKEDLQDDEEKLIKRINQLEDRGRDVSKYEKQLNDVEAELEKIEEDLELMQDIGIPDYRLQSPRRMLLRALLKPDDREERIVDALDKEHPKMFDHRILMANIEADVARWKEAQGKGERGAEVQARKKRADLEDAKETFDKVWGDVRGDCQEELEEVKERDTRLTERAQRSERSAERYREELAAIAARMEKLNDTLKVLDLIAKPSAAEGGDEKAKAKAKPKPGKKDKEVKPEGKARPGKEGKPNEKAGKGEQPDPAPKKEEK